MGHQKHSDSFFCCNPAVLESTGRVQLLKPFFLLCGVEAHIGAVKDPEKWLAASVSESFRTQPGYCFAERTLQNGCFARARCRGAVKAKFVRRIKPFGIRINTKRQNDFFHMYRAFPYNGECSFGNISCIQRRNERVAEVPFSGGIILDTPCHRHPRLLPDGLPDIFA